MSYGDYWKRFTIVWVEDEWTTRLEQEKTEISHFLQQKGFEPDIRIAKNDGEAKSSIQPLDVIDMIVTDLNISGSTETASLLKFIAENKILADVVIYTARATRNELRTAKNSLPAHLNVESVHGRGTQLTQTIKKIANKNIDRSRSIVMMRGMGLSEAIGLEVKIEDVLKKYLNIKRAQHEKFESLILQNSHFSFEGKVQAIRQILERHDLKRDPELKGLIDTLSEIAKRRNYLAHCKTFCKKNMVYLRKMSEPKALDRKFISSLLRDIAKASSQLDTLSKKPMPVFFKQ